MSQPANTPAPRGYRERKLVDPPLCARAGCRCAPADDSDRCPGHRDGHRRASASSAKKIRARRRKRKQCAFCGVPSKRYRCPACKVRGGRVRAAGVGNGVDNTAARTWKDPDGRTRFHGQLRKGRQSNAALDAQDLRDGIKAFQRALDGLAYIQGAEVQQMAPIARAEAERAYLSLVDLGSRFGEEVLERRRYREQLAKAAPRPRG